MLYSIYIVFHIIDHEQCAVLRGCKYKYSMHRLKGYSAQLMNDVLIGHHGIVMVTMQGGPHPTASSWLPAVLFAVVCNLIYITIRIVVSQLSRNPPVIPVSIIATGVHPTLWTLIILSLVYFHQG